MISETRKTKQSQHTIHTCRSLFLHIRMCVNASSSEVFLIFIYNFLCRKISRHIVKSYNRAVLINNKFLYSNSFNEFTLIWTYPGSPSLQLNIFFILARCSSFWKPLLSIVLARFPTCYIVSLHERLEMRLKYFFHARKFCCCRFNDGASFDST